MVKDYRFTRILWLITQWQTYSQIGETLGVTKQRVQQILTQEGYRALPKEDHLCSFCHTRKPKGEFYFSAGNAGSICKPCNKLRMRQYAKTHRAEIQATASKSYRLHKDRAIARSNAEDSFPITQPCEVAGCKQLGQRHHDDYSKPLDIRWLCLEHHTAEHSK